MSLPVAWLILALPRTLAAPTDHEDQPSDAERADPDRDRPDTTVTPQAQPHLFAGSDDSPDGPR